MTTRHTRQDGVQGVDHPDGGPGADTCRNADTWAGCESAWLRR